MDARSDDAIINADAIVSWTSQLRFDFNCSDELYEAIAEEKDENKLTLRELVLKRVYEREQAFKLRERILTQKIQDLEAQLLLLTAQEDQENRKPVVVVTSAKNKKPSTSTVDVTKTHSPLAMIGDRQINT